jgi:hypothetical protein
MTDNQESLAHNKGLEIIRPQAFGVAGTLLLEVRLSDVDLLPVVQYAEEHGFAPKNEYHFTIIGRHTGDALMARLQSVSTEERRLLEDRLHAIVSYLRGARLMSGEYFHVARDYDRGRRESIIQVGTVEGLDDFYQQFSALTHITLEDPFPHVTLFTKGDSADSRRGIGIASTQAFASMEHWPITPRL